MKGLFGLAVGASCAIVVACMSADHKASQAPVRPQTMPEAGMSAAAPRPNSPEADEIDRLMKSIDEQRDQLKLPEQHGDLANPMVAPIAPQAECRPATETCKQSCTLSGSICDNAKQICDIAKKLDNDKWAEQKCADGNATCNAAHKECCDCSK